MPTNEPVTGLCLPFLFDEELLRKDLERIAAGAWQQHYNDLDFNGQWRGVALRSATGSPTDLTASPAGETSFVNTSLLDACPYFRTVLARFHCPLKTVRLLGLAPNSFIREHSDNALDFEDGEVRLHIPIQTNPLVEFFVRGDRLRLEQGHCYYVNVNLPHRVNNRGGEERIHLVIDAEVNPWIRDVFSGSQPIPLMEQPLKGVDDFRRLVAADETLRERLRMFSQRREFIRATVSEGEDRGFDFHEADADAAFRRSLPGTPAPNTGWSLARLELREPEPIGEWICAPGERFTEPFFDDSIRRFLRNPLTAFTRTTAQIAQVTGPDPVCMVTGFIFHMSRCGSTLISRTLASSPHIRVISEAAPIDAILQSAAPAKKKIQWLRQTVAALGPEPQSSETHYLVKLDAWHIHHLPLIAEAFPQTPWIFVHRDPLEVLVSQLRQPGLHMIQSGRGDTRAVEWGAHVLAGFLTAALESAESLNGIFVDYRELPHAIWGRVARHFGLVFTAEEATALQEAACLDAKTPYLPFEPDTDRKQNAAIALRNNPAVQELTGIYRRLTSIGA